MNSLQKEKQILKKYYSSFLEAGIPTFILDDIKNWMFFLQEGINFEYNWNYNTELSIDNKKQLYHLLQQIRDEGIESCLLNELEEQLQHNQKDKK